MAIRTRWHPFEDLRRAQDELAQMHAMLAGGRAAREAAAVTTPPPPQPAPAPIPVGECGPRTRASTERLPYVGEALTETKEITGEVVMPLPRCPRCGSAPITIMFGAYPLVFCAGCGARWTQTGSDQRAIKQVQAPARSTSARYPLA
jgi:hypothetical protein